MKIIFNLFISICPIVGYSQTDKIQLSTYDGSVIIGYVDRGAYINFAGPHISYSYKTSKIGLGMLPSLRIKEDKSITKNSMFTPSLAVGIHYITSFWVLQIPLFYKPKTATENGRWQVGVGVGIRLNKFNK